MLKLRQSHECNASNQAILSPAKIDINSVNSAPAHQRNDDSISSIKIQTEIKTTKEEIEAKKCAQKAIGEQIRVCKCKTAKEQRNHTAECNHRGTQHHYHSTQTEDCCCQS